MKKTIPVLAAAVGFLCPCGLCADVKLPTIFGDHMVLQQEARLPVWGWADPGEKVTVAVGRETATATGDANGKWMVQLQPLPDGTPPVTMTVTGKNTVTFTDVLVGEVWVCTGQSNMEFRLSQAEKGPVEIQNANDTQLRLFHAVSDLALSPHDNVVGSWEVCSPSSVPQFSAVGYFFGKKLRGSLKRPVGLIESCNGGTSAQAWTSLSALQANPTLENYVDDFKKFSANFPGGDAEFAARQEAVEKWKQQIHDDPAYQAALKAWSTASAKAKAAGQPIPSQPALPIPAPPMPYVSGHIPTIWFNGTLAPLIPYAIKGVIWYQGEGNTGNTSEAFNYRTLLPTLIGDWRARWGQGNFPFLFVQLANFGPLPKAAGDSSNFALVRESQLKSLAVPNTGMAVVADIGTAGNIHYPDKADVGARLALAARHTAYGENVTATGPIYDSMKIEGDKIRITFRPDSIGGGLVIGTAPWIDPKAAPVSKIELQSFAVAGSDENWVWADAKIDGNTIIVSSPQVAKPVAVRYGWADAPVCNLYNRESLPASPFRTDEWQMH